MFEGLIRKLQGVRATLADEMAVTRRANRTGTIMLRSDGRYRGRVQLGVDDAGAVDTRTVYGSTRAEVEKKIADLVHEHDRGELDGVEASRLTLGAFLTDHYLPMAKPLVRPSTYTSYEQISRLHLVPLLGRVPLSKLSVRLIQKALSGLTEEGLSPYRVRNCHRVLHRALVYAVRWRILASNPSEYVELPKMPRITRPTLDQAQVQKLITTGPQQYRLLWELALVTGARQGELLGLRWADVDWNERKLGINRSFGQFGYQPPKNGKTRTVPLPPLVIDTLLAWRAVSPYGGPDHPIFVSRNGTPLLWMNVTRTYKRTLRACGISEAVRFHDLRHTHATALLKSKLVTVAAVSGVLGHYSPAVTHGIYDHGGGDQDDQYREALARVFGA